MSYSDLLQPRRDVLSEDGIEGIIDLANLADAKKRKLESRPADFFALTYPTVDTKRVPSCRVRFEHAPDKARVVLHRFFQNYLSADPECCRPTVESYTAAWSRNGGMRDDDFSARFSESYPFSPDVLLKGRVQPHTQGPGANKLYKHGGRCPQGSRGRPPPSAQGRDRMIGPLAHKIGAVIGELRGPVVPVTVAPTSSFLALLSPASSTPPPSSVPRRSLWRKGSDRFL